MLDTYRSIVISDAFLVFLAFTVFSLLFLFVPRPGHERRRPMDRGAWMRKNYWLLMLGVGLSLLVLGIWLYLFDIGRTVRNLVDALLIASRKPDISEEDSQVIRNLGHAAALLLARSPHRPRWPSNWSASGQPSARQAPPKRA